MTAAQCGTEFPGELCIACINGATCSAGVCVTSGTTGTPAIPLIGCVSTTYLAPMKFGSSSTVFRMIVDTGSSDTAIATSGCTGCAGDAGVTLFYGDTGSNTGQTDSTQYADGSGWNGSVYSDTIGMLGIGADLTLVDFAAISTQSGFFGTGDCSGNPVPFSTNQGLVGMGPTDLLGTGTNDYFYQLTAASPSIAKVFAVQMCNTTGTIWLGGFDSNAVASTPQYTPMTTTPSPYFQQVNLNGATFGSAALGTAGEWSPCVIDTGTYGIGLPSDAYATLQNDLEANAAFNSLFGFPAAGYTAFFGTSTTSSTECVSTTGGQGIAAVNQMLPSMTFTFPSSTSTFTITVPATQSYLFAVDSGLANGGVNYCWGAFDNGTSSSSPGSLLGDTFMQNAVTVFDIGSNRIGFAQATTCPAPPTGGMRKDSNKRPPSIPFPTVRNPHGPRRR
jgi:hypothetical protein